MFLNVWGSVNFFAVKEHAADGLTLAEQNLPAPSNVSPEQVTPGTLGFIVTLIMAIAVIVIGLCITRSIRKVRYHVPCEESAHEPRAAEATEDKVLVHDR